MNIADLLFESASENDGNGDLQSTGLKSVIDSEEFFADDEHESFKNYFGDGESEPFQGLFEDEEYNSFQELFEDSYSFENWWYDETTSQEFTGDGQYNSSQVVSGGYGSKSFQAWAKWAEINNGFKFFTNLRRSEWSSNHLCQAYSHLIECQDYYENNTEIHCKLFEKLLKLRRSLCTFVNPNNTLYLTRPLSANYYTEVSRLYQQRLLPEESNFNSDFNMAEGSSNATPLYSYKCAEKQAFGQSQFNNINASSSYYCFFSDMKVTKPQFNIQRSAPRPASNKPRSSFNNFYKKATESRHDARKGHRRLVSLRKAKDSSLNHSVKRRRLTSSTQRYSGVSKTFVSHQDNDLDEYQDSFSYSDDSSIEFII